VSNDTPTPTGVMFEEWRSYDRDVVPSTAGDVQREECRRAFYAGAWAAFCAVLAASEPPDEEECERRLEALQSEIMAAPSDLSIERPQRTES
jgi:hypothetical protein